MTAKENIEERLKKLGSVIGSQNSFLENVMPRIAAKPPAGSDRTAKFKNKLIISS